MFPLSIYSQYSILGASSSAFNSGQYSILANIRAARGENCKYCQKYLNLRWISCAGTSFVGEGASPIPTNSAPMAFDFDQEWLQQSSTYLLSSFADDDDDVDDDHHLDGDDGDGDAYGDDLLTRKSSRNFLLFLGESSIQIPHIFYSLFPSSLTKKKAQRQMSRSYVDSF